MTLRGRRVARRCFVATGTKLILPAFGALTGGLDADHPEILRAVGAGAEALVPPDDRLLRFPIPACRTPVARGPAQANIPDTRDSALSPQSAKSRRWKRGGSTVRYRVLPDT